MTDEKLLELCDELQSELTNAKAGLDKDGKPFKWKTGLPLAS